MCRALVPGIVFLLLAGCALPPEQTPLKPLPDNAPPQTFSDLTARARGQANLANESFFVNKWSDLDDVARALEQTARHLDKALDVPAKFKDTLAVKAGDLGREAIKLREAARDRDEKKANAALQKINLQVRQLRPDD